MTVPQPIPGAEVNAPTTVSRVQSHSIADLLFRTLYLVFNPRTSFKTFPPWRSAAFAKRILVACLSWPPASVLRALELVEVLLNKEPRLEALLSTDDRTGDGIYRGDLNDPQLCNAFASNFWELRMLESSHFEVTIRKQAGRLANYARK
jgi:nucleolar complex protein 3